MDVEIVFTGLCAFLNVEKHNPTMGDPSVILVRADGHDHGSVSTKSRRRDAGQPDPDEHIAFIAFHIDKARVDDDKGFKPVFESVRNHYYRMNGVEISIETDPPGSPRLDEEKTFHNVVRKDDYWPQAKDKWNRDFVPERSGRPKKSAVTAFLRLGGGEISGARISPFDWVFEIPDGKGEHRGKFAEEVVYKFSQDDDTLVFTLSDLDDPRTVVRTLRFSPLPANPGKLTIFIGNNVVGDMDNAVERRPPEVVEEGDHFKFLNRIADTTELLGKPAANGPIPKAEVTPLPPGLGGGTLQGPCGPIGGNGKP